MKIVSLIILILVLPIHFSYSKENFSILTKEEAEALFVEISSNKEIPFDFPDGCFAKAQKIAMILDQKHIVSGKAFIEGQIFYHSHWGDSFWLYHVAPFVLVQDQNKLKHMIIDPFISNHLLNFDEWMAKVKKDPRTKISSNYFTNRFVYDPEDKEKDLDQYNLEYIRDMEIVFKQIKKRLDR